MIKVQNLYKNYEDFPALRDISFSVQEGEVLGLLGPNGAGKTTLLRILVGFLKPTKGEVEIEGMDVSRAINGKKIKALIGYLPEHAPLYEDMMVEEYLYFIAEMQGLDDSKTESRVKEVIKTCALEEKRNSEISTLSKGYRQRVGIAQAIVHDPKIVVLDEPTTGLDPNQRIEIRDLIKKIGESHIVILSSHILSEVQSTCSRVLIINKGKIIADGSAEELENKGQENIPIKLEVSSLIDGLISKIESIDGVVSIQCETNMVYINTIREKDLRSEISKIVVESGCGLLGLERKQASLEDVFISLTSKEDE